MDKGHIRIAKELKVFALGLPGAYENIAWGQSVARAKKVFIYFDRSDEEKEANSSLTSEGRPRQWNWNHTTN